MKTIKIKHPTLDENMEVDKEDYIKVETKHLKEWGYTDLTISDVRLSVDKILKGEKPSSVIDYFVAQDIIVE